MRKALLTVALLLFALAITSAQAGAASSQELGKTLYNSFKSNTQANAQKLYPALPEVMAIKGAKATADDSTIIKFATQLIAKKLDDDWTTAKNKLEADGVIWDKADMPAVSNEPYMGDNKRECAIVQVMFTVGDKKHVISAKCTTVNGRWYVIEDIKPFVQNAY